MNRFTSPIATQIDRFLAHKRGLGFAYCSEEWLLGEFDRLTTEVELSEPVLEEPIIRRFVAEGARGSRSNRIREAAVKDFPPKPGSGRKPSSHGIPAQIQAAREARGLTSYALAKLAGIPNQATIRDIEQGKDVRLSNLQSVADTLGLKLELVEQVG